MKRMRKYMKMVEEMQRYGYSCQHYGISMDSTSNDNSSSQKFIELSIT